MTINGSYYSMGHMFNGGCMGKTLFTQLIVMFFFSVFINTANANSIHLKCKEKVDDRLFEYSIFADVNSGKIIHHQKTGTFYVDGKVTNNFITYSIAAVADEDGLFTIISDYKIDRKSLESTRDYSLKTGDREAVKMNKKVGSCKVDSSPQKKSADFRGSNWGDTKASVIALKGKPAKNTRGEAIYLAKIAGLEALSVYKFTNDKLYTAYYGIDQEHSNKNTYIADYHKIKRLLTKKYGVPKNTESTWGNPLYKSDPSNWGLAVSIGHLEFHSYWETPRTLIHLFLKGDNYKIGHLLIYKSKSLAKEANQAKSNDDISEL